MISDCTTGPSFLRNWTAGANFRSRVSRQEKNPVALRSLSDRRSRQQLPPQHHGSKSPPFERRAGERRSCEGQEVRRPRCQKASQATHLQGVWLQGWPCRNTTQANPLGLTSRGRRSGCEPTICYVYLQYVWYRIYR